MRHCQGTAAHACAAVLCSTESGCRQKKILWPTLGSQLVISSTVVETRSPAPTYTLARAHTHAHARTHTHTCPIIPYVSCQLAAVGSHPAASLCRDFGRCSVAPPPKWRLLMVLLYVTATCFATLAAFNSQAPLYWIFHCFAWPLPLLCIRTLSTASLAPLPSRAQPGSPSGLQSAR